MISRNPRVVTVLMASCRTAVIIVRDIVELAETVGAVAERAPVVAMLISSLSTFIRAAMKLSGRNKGQG